MLNSYKLLLLQIMKTTQIKRVLQKSKVKLMNIKLLFFIQTPRCDETMPSVGVRHRQLKRNTKQYFRRNYTGWLFRLRHAVWKTASCIWWREPLREETFITISRYIINNTYMKSSLITFLFWIKFKIVCIKDIIDFILLLTFSLIINVYITVLIMNFHITKKEVILSSGDQAKWMKKILLETVSLNCGSYY